MRRASGEASTPGLRKGVLLIGVSYPRKRVDQAPRGLLMSILLW